VTGAEHAPWKQRSEHMNPEDDTEVLSIGESTQERGEEESTSNLDHWGTDAVPLGKDKRGRQSMEGSRHAKTIPHSWVALAAIICLTGGIISLGANLGKQSVTTRTDQPRASLPRDQAPAQERGTNALTTRRVARRQRPARLKSRPQPISSPHPKHSVPSPTYDPAREPTPQPVGPIPAPASAPLRHPTTKPQPASGPTVAKEFGFER